MKVVETDEAQATFRDLLAEVEDGATIAIVEDGSPVARLVPIPATPKPGPKVAKAIDEWLEYREKHDITLGEDLTIRDLIAEGRM
ncbi:MAG: type II toxin-antitoxin system prevent-host-death family antitoxin [Chloroflexota bacterium]|nr:type II toxin-antitoxin system prevent-host-death family antitoxin [Chloroflexota bacterium]